MDFHYWLFDGGYTVIGVLWADLRRNLKPLTIYMLCFILNTGATESRDMKWVFWGNKQLHTQELIYTKAPLLYKGCSESNASCFIILVHSVRGGYCWDGSRGRTFPSVSHYVSLPCDRWHWIPPWRKSGTRWHSLMLAECLWKPTGVWILWFYVSSVRQWAAHFSSSDNNSGSPPLVQIVTSAACRL